MEATKQLTRALALTVLAAVFSARADITVRESTCDLETGLCGWRLGESKDGFYSVGLAEADQAPGPPVDAAPGTAQGSYVFLNYSSPPIGNQDTLLSFPTYQYVCSLSLSYHAPASLELNAVRVNIGQNYLLGNASAIWQRASQEYNVSSVEEEDREFPLRLTVEGYVLGEAEGEAEEEGEGFQVMAVDDITLTFCLPCDFDLLPQPGNLQLTAAPALTVALGNITTLLLSASSPLCPTLPLVFMIEAVEPPELAGILSVDSESGVVTVDGIGPHLLAAGTSGHMNVSVHVLSSNYKQTGLAYRTTASVRLEQAPVIRLHDTPSEMTVEVGVPFSLQIHAAHLLASTQPLSYSLHMTPDSLQPLASISSLGEVTGVIAIETLPDILTAGGANLTVGVANEYNSFLDVTIPLVFPPSPPLLRESNLNFSVSENHSSVNGVLLALLHLIDPNGDPVDVPYTTWFNQTFQLAPFGLDSDGWSQTAGLFAEAARLDYEQRSSYTLSLTITDSADPSLLTAVSILINVRPENEHAPKFINFRDKVRIQATWDVDSLLTPVQATDQDEGPGGEVSYAITDGNQDQFFKINESVGDVRVASSPILPGTYTITITASDHGTPQHSTSDVLTISVEATGAVDCSLPNYTVPAIHNINQISLTFPAGSNATLYCSYTADPAVALYKWEVNPVVTPPSSLVYPLPSPSPHLSLLPHQLTLVGVAASDAAVYTCNVTNWCGSSVAVHILFIIDYPLPVLAVSGKGVPLSPAEKDNLSPTSYNISWTPPTIAEHASPFVEVTMVTYLVQARLHADEHGDSYRDFAEVPSSVVSVIIEGLLPGNNYDVRVLSVNEAGATPSDDITVALPPTAPKLSSVDTRQEANLSLLVTWELAYDGGYPISLFTITIQPQSPRARRQAGGVVYNVDPTVGSLLSSPLEAGRRYLVTLTVGNQLDSRQYTISEYIGHVETVQCDFEPQQQCPWQLEGATITTTPSGGIVEASLSRDSSKVILRHPAAGYSCGYGFSYQLWGGVGLQLTVGGGGGVIWEDQGDTGEEWRQVSTSDFVDVDYVTPRLDDTLEMVATGNSSGGGVRLDELFLDFCLPCDLSDLHQPGRFTLTYPNTTTLYLRESSQLLITATLADCDTAVLTVSDIRVVPSVLESSVSVAVSAHSIFLSVQSIPPDLAAPHTTGVIQVSVFVVGSDYASPVGGVASAVVGVAVIEFSVEERPENCSDVIGCGFDEGGACGWSLGDDASLSDSGSSSVGVWLPLSQSQAGDLVLSRVFSGDSYCRLSLDFIVQGAELVAAVSGVGVVWTSGTHDSHTRSTANFTFDLQATSVMAEWNVTLSLAEVWNRDGSVYLDDVTLYPCTQCSAPSECPFLCPAGQACPEVDPDQAIPCPPDQYSFLGQDTCQPCPQGFSCSDASSVPTPDLEDCQQSHDSRSTMVIVVAGLSGVVVLLLVCCMCTAICCLRRTRKATVESKRRRQVDRQRLVGPDSDSIGTAASLSRASQAGDQRRWKKYGESSTLMTFMSEEDDPSAGGLRQEASWLQTVELTHTKHPRGAGGAVRGLGARGEVMQNPVYEDEEEEEDEEREKVEMSAMEDWALPPPPPTTSSHF